MQKLPKLKPGDKIAIVSPSFAAPGKWPHIYELGLKRLREDFGLEPVSFPTTSKIEASSKDRAADLISAFEDPTIKAVIASLGGNDQVTYIKNLPGDVFKNNPKPFFGFSDNTHFVNHLWLNGVPSFYGASLFTQFGQTPRMEEFTTGYIKKALFEDGEIELKSSPVFNDIGISWDDPGNMAVEKIWEPSESWKWDGNVNTEGITWGGCLESIDELLRHSIVIPSLEQFEDIVLFTETSEEIPNHEYVLRVYRALGERGILERVKAILVGRPKSWEFDKQNSHEWKQKYRQKQRQTILDTVRKYNSTIPVIQNIDIGHTDPQICLPYGMSVRIDSTEKRIFAQF